MPLPDGLTKHVPLPFVRALAVLGFLAVFYTAASLFQPSPSSALPAAAPAPKPLAAGHNVERFSPRTTPALVGTLTGVQYTLDVYLTPAGARYTVKDLVGNILADQLSGDDLYRDFPDLDVDQMHADLPANSDADFD